MPAIRRRAYVLRPGALDALAGRGPELRTAQGDPNVSAIGAAAGIDPTTLLRIKNKQIGLSARAMAALVDLQMGRGMDRETAEASLFDLVPVTPDALEEVAA